MTSEMREILEKVWKNNAEKNMSLSHVISTACTALRADKLGAGSIYAELIGDGSSNKAKRSHFLEVFYSRMSYVVYNGTNKRVVVEWVKVNKDDLAKQNRAIREYHIMGEEPVQLKECLGHIEKMTDVNKTFKITHESGYVQEIPMLDAEGKKITEQRLMCFVPREKSVWGYTTDVKVAFFEALEVVENEAAEAAKKNEK